MDKRYNICLTIAFLLHALAIFFLQFQRIIEERARAVKMIGVEYREEEEKKKKEEKKKEEKKEEKKLLAPKTPTVTMEDKLKLMRIQEKIPEEDLKKLAQIATPLKMADADKVIDIDKMLEAHKGQIAIDLDQFEKLDIEAGIGELEVLRIGSGMSTDEILKQDVVELPMAALKGGRLGLWTTPGVAISGGTGEGGSGIELERATAEDIKEQKEAIKKAFEKPKEQIGKKEAVGEGKPITEVEITGALKDREQIERPLPPYPDWALRRGISAYLRVQVKVGPEGKISGTVLPLLTTGYPEWDNAVINWIKKYWKWKAVPGLTSPGTISFRFIIG